MTAANTYADCARDYNDKYAASPYGISFASEKATKLML
jgi:hypothetical protein